MKNSKQFLVATVGLILFASLGVNAFAMAAHTSALTASVVVGGAGLMFYKLSTLQSNNPVAHTAGIQVEIWAQYIIERFWKDNGFMKRAFSDDDKVLAGKVVHIPQPGAKPSVTKNRGVFPATAVRRTDTDIVYVLDEYTTDPTHIPDADKYELSYDKIDSVYGDHAGELVEFVGDDIILKWLDESVSNVTKLYTTGGKTADVTAATTDSATGNRYVTHHLDLKAWQLQFNKNNIPKANRQVLFESNMLDQFTSSLTDSQYRDFSQYYNATEGIIGRLYGFDILDRSNVAVANAAHAIKALGAAGAAGDCAVSLVWQKDAVARALGDVKFFENPDRAEYYGDIYSALLRMGGRRRRADNLGVGAMIQGTAA
ncbi:hypothetical protein MTO98_26605 [Mucilaginibacter sp. SMC90]|uniref:hypothetical protein n=1 Tax=Mucilaginibacter sp. SMC90 TaxID=2929803 RepID=UPI001FB32B0B|nr:hypothetical protein [Mucilaginibacter sp. SMC90]UOE47986.1 hypothetical protein MTO98_26605 [Mucilaginibacter sp. SMC90]